MSLLIISGISIRLGGRLLLDEADLTVDPGRRIEQVIERIAAGTGDHQQVVVRPDREGLAVDRRILPTGVVHQGVRPERIEDALIQPVGQGGARSRGQAERRGGGNGICAQGVIFGERAACARYRA